MHQVHGNEALNENEVLKNGRDFHAELFFHICVFNTLVLILVAHILTKIGVQNYSKRPYDLYKCIWKS